ncbi:MAG: extracellular solute-binding protein [bacterium]
MSKYYKISLIAIILASLVFLPGAICKTPQAKPKEITLEVWNLFDDSDAFRDIIADYKLANANITIKYYKKDYAGYEDLILNSMAEGDGPDIFLINSQWVEKYMRKIVSMSQNIPSAEEVPKPFKKIGISDIEKDFADVVYDDVISDGKIYALPLSVDTLALYYNKDMFNNAGVPKPPTDWTDFKDVVRKLREVDEKSNIIKAGAAMGTAQNISRSSDLLMLLMAQTGTPMVGGNGSLASFDQMIASGENMISPGANALKFYTDFANSAHSFYTWNPKMESSIDVFAQEKCAMIFGYSYLEDEIKKKQPYGLNFSAAKIPQIKNSAEEINFANYWVFAVSRLSKSPNAAWDFVKFLTSRTEAEKYLTATKKPTALRDLILSQTQSDDPILKTFAGQVLTARSWPQKDSAAMEKIFMDMIDDVNYGRRSAEEALKYGASRATQVLGE